MKFNNLIIGCANVGQKYGINKKIIKKKEFQKIYKLAIKKKIYSFDTATDYGESEKVLGNVINSNIKKIRLISKLPKSNDKNYYNKIEKSIKRSLKNLNAETLFAIHIHDPNLLIKKNKFQIYQALLKAKQKKLIKNIGVSVYEEQELKKILSYFKIDIIQIPVNILDHRFLKKNLLKKIKRQVKEIHVRSIFLKGLLLKNKLTRPKYFNKWSIFKKVDTFFEKNNFNRLDFCLNFVRNIKEIDKIIIGVSSKKQLLHILKTKKKTSKLPNFLTQNVAPKKLLIPKYWKI